MATTQSADCRCTRVKLCSIQVQVVCEARAQRGNEGSFRTVSVTQLPAGFPLGTPPADLSLFHSLWEGGDHGDNLRWRVMTSGREQRGRSSRSFRSCRIFPGRALIGGHASPTPPCHSIPAHYPYYPYSSLTPPSGNNLPERRSLGHQRLPGTASKGRPPAAGRPGPRRAPAALLTRYGRRAAPPPPCSSGVAAAAPDSLPAGGPPARRRYRGRGGAHYLHYNGVRKCNSKALL